MLEKTKKTRNTRAYYAAVKLMQSKEAPKLFDIRNMYPGNTDEEIAEIIAEFFNKISLEYPPIPNPARESQGIMYYEKYQIAARLRTFKKPKSMVFGDIFPELVTKYSDLLAIPLQYCLLYTSPSPRDLSTSRMPSSA